MGENIQISINTLELLDIDFKSNYNHKDGNKEETSLDISYEIQDKETVDFTINFVYVEKQIRVKGSYLFSIEIKNLENLNDFIENEKEQLIYPVYTKISGIINYLTDQVLPFPLIISPSIWIDDSSEGSDEKE